MLGDGRLGGDRPPNNPLRRRRRLAAMMMAVRRSSVLMRRHILGMHRSMTRAVMLGIDPSGLAASTQNGRDKSGTSRNQLRLHFRNSLKFDGWPKGYL